MSETVLLESQHRGFIRPHVVSHLAELALQDDPFPGFSDLQTNVILLASHGGTTNEVAAALDECPEDINSAAGVIIEEFAAPNMAASIHRAILTGILPVKKVPDLGIRNRLKQRDISTLKFIAEGKTNRQIAVELDKSPASLVSNINRPLFKKLKASGRTHSVRRSHEFGLI